ncbi:DNA-binding MarR family transcriptional regulator [Pullulanibacillus pueri]|uniref:MarR family transcriptional regulator n=1 Tax=Pullulanibacillus pueri TaxID=1437324 RepID=A0A8J2ZZA6_9BACL|nr:winged helix DNA-binding protein [Pullulanibacillus pueri]MBM7683384.1 DNA-binding MarR family transcriptional regulator [Pullulanibacillus pueri]GGH86530.1 MarR family transcriptional regulator [Pullulanibacillus pueri]
MNTEFKEAEAFRYLILAVQRQGNKMLKAYLKNIGVTPSQAEVMSVLKKYQPIALKELGHLLICEEGSPSRLVERMVKENLIERIRDQRDSRYVRLVLTPLGNEKYELIIKAEADMYHRVEALYSKEELMTANQMLRKIILGTPLEQALEDRGFV